MRTINIVFVTILIYLSIFCYCSKKENEPIIAQIGDIKITVAEFQNRYEFTPQIMQTNDKARNKRNFLISLLGEKVFAEEAYSRNLHKTEKFETYAKQMEKEAIVEALFDKEITSKIKVTQDELKQAYSRSKRELDVQVLSFDNEEDVKKARQLLTAGKSFHDVKMIFQKQDFISVDSVLTLAMKWGEAHPDIEDAAYRLKFNEVSEPIFLQGEYFILKLVNQKAQFFRTEADFYQQSPSLEKIIRRRKKTKMFNEFSHSIMKGKKLRVSHEMFDFVATELEKLYVNKNDRTESTNSTPLKRDIETVLSSATLADHLNDTFARFDDGPNWTISDFIKKLSVGAYPLNSKSKNEFKSRLRHTIRRMAEFESLAKKGYKLGLNKTHYVKYQTQMWNDAFIAQELKRMIIDTIKVNDDVKLDVLKNKKLDAYLTKFSEQYKIKIYPAVYDTIKTYDISIMVLKRHFPNRLAAPAVAPLHTFHGWQKKMDAVFPK